VELVNTQMVPVQTLIIALLKELSALLAVAVEAVVGRELLAAQIVKLRLVAVEVKQVCRLAQTEDGPPVSEAIVRWEILLLKILRWRLIIADMCVALGQQHSVGHMTRAMFIPNQLGNYRLAHLLEQTL
jgi:hypothetical protein